MGCGDWFPWKTDEEAMNFRLGPMKLAIDDLKIRPEGYIYHHWRPRKYQSEGFRTPSGKVEIYSPNWKGAATPLYLHIRNLPRALYRRLRSQPQPYADMIEEGTGDPLRALAARYLKIPCSCMTPNNRRLTELDRLIVRFRPDAVVDVVLHACHSYNVESIKVGQHVRGKHALSFLKIVTDYSPSDMEQISVL